MTSNDHPSPNHPRPQLQRKNWLLLDGQWRFSLDPEAQENCPQRIDWNAEITVPFSPETKASGIHNTGLYSACWYQRSFTPPEMQDGERLLLHFGAVDHSATVWVNGQQVATHEGGYTPFQCDITDLLTGQDTHLVTVRAFDDPHDLAMPRGKQGWQLEPHAIWYPRTTGIWQSVWIEVVPRCWLTSIRWSCSLERWDIGIEACIAGKTAKDLRLKVRLRNDQWLLADDEYAVVNKEVHRRIVLSDPGIDDYRNELLWSPSSPTLIQAHLQLTAGDEVIDEVVSYTAIRSIAVQGDRFVLNGRPMPLRMVLDQGYWPDSGATAPDDDAFRRDIELTKAMGFNAVRKHQKIEDPRYLYWADHLGLMVWEEMPSAYRFTRQSVVRVTEEWMKVIARDCSHPCIIAWVPFNESWGVPDLPDSPTQRHYVQSLYHLTKTLDPTRPVVGNDGWESIATDIIGIHDYDDEPDQIAKRYGLHENAASLFQRERPGGHLLLLNEDGHAGRPVMLTEFGGIALAADKRNTWGYSSAEDSADFAKLYCALMKVVRALPILSGFCYTQFADTYQEANGLLYADRTPKMPIEQIAIATHGERRARDLQREFEWRERLMQDQTKQYHIEPRDYQLHDAR